MKRILLIAATMMAMSLPAEAGFDSWTHETEEDPFSGGERVVATYSASLRSGALIMCDSAQSGMMLRVIPGYTSDPSYAGFEPEMEVAFDGKRVLGQTGETGAVGDNLAVAQVMLTPENAALFVEGFKKASKQVAIKDGMSDRPHLLRARGSTKAGEALQGCLDKQKP
jgi:hypothetical protein